MDEVRFQTKIRREKNPIECNSVILEKIEGDPRRNILFVRSFLNVTTQIHMRIMEEKNKSLNIRYIGQLNILLQRLILYLFGVDDQDDLEADPDFEPGDREPIPINQMIVRDYGLLDNLIEICRVPLKLTNIANSVQS